jgi:alpha-N-arabinofuranosidase
MRHWLLALPLLALAPGAGAGSYNNPVLPGFYPDPSICRVGADYYLATSTFEYFPGVPIFHSKDLVHWRQLGHALTRPSQLPLAGQRSSNGIFAPTLRCVGGKFYIVTTNFGGAGNFIVQASDPAGPWSEPAWIKEKEWGIDPSLLFDDDGKVYFTRADGGEHGGVNQAEIDIATGQLKGPTRRIWNGTGGTWPEAPHLFKINGWYYLTIAEGGTGYEHAVTMARAKSPWGPFEAAPNNPVITHKTHPDLPLQATGHADLVQTPDGHWFMVLLGIRPVGRAHHMGRETMLAPVTWTPDGWLKVNDGAPIATTMTAAGLPASHPWAAAPVRDNFDAPAPGLAWAFLRGPADGLWSLAARPGSLRLAGSKVGLEDIGTPAFIGRRQQHLAMRAATLLDFTPADATQSAGLVLRMNEDNHYQLVVGGAAGGGRVVRLVTRVKGVTKVLREMPVKPGPVELAVRAAPAQYRFSYRVGTGAAVEMGSAATRALSSEDAGGFTGVFIGLYAHNGGAGEMAPADFDWFDYQPQAAPVAAGRKAAAP